MLIHIYAVGIQLLSAAVVLLLLIHCLLLLPLLLENLCLVHVF